MFFFFKVARSQSLNKIVWRRASDYLGLMDEPAICQSVLGPQTGKENVPGVVKWSLADSQMITHIPFYLLGEHEGKVSDHCMGDLSLMVLKRILLPLLSYI